MGIMSAIGGMFAKNPLVTALAGGGLLPTLLAARKSGAGPQPIQPGTGGQNTTPYMGPGFGQGDTSGKQNPNTLPKLPGSFFNTSGG
jgi:hypothetical protein